MRPTERSQAIVFLLSCGAIPLGCPASDDDDDTNATTPGTTNPSTAAGTDAGDGDASGSTDGNTPSTTLSSTTDPDSGDGSSSTDGYGTCSIDTVPAVCTMFAAHVIKCDGKSAGYVDSLEQECACAIDYYVSMYGAGCAAAFEDLYACLSALACDDMTKDPCATEDAAVDAACSSDG